MSSFGTQTQNPWLLVHQQIVVIKRKSDFCLHSYLPVPFLNGVLIFIFFRSKVETAKKIVIPESIAIKLANSSEVSAEYFFHDMYRRYQQLQNKDRKGLKSSKRNRIHKVPSSELAANREHKKLLETIRSTTSTVDISSISDRSTTIPFQQQQQQQLQTTTSNSYILQTKDQVAYVDDEDLENDLEASGLNRIRNETSIAYHFDENSENDN